MNTMYVPDDSAASSHCGMPYRCCDQNGSDDGEKGDKMPADEGMSFLNPVEMQYMTGWNEIMYSSLRRRNAVILSPNRTSDRLAKGDSFFEYVSSPAKTQVCEVLAGCWRAGSRPALPAEPCNVSKRCH